MFTGLIQSTGTIIEINTQSDIKKIIIKCPHLIASIALGDSVAVNGACLTASSLDASSFCANVGYVTQQKTTLGNLKVHDTVNLELSLRPTDRMGGHIVQGHVNGIGSITQIKKIGHNHEVWIAIPHELEKYIISEGSIAIDGISVTIAKKMDKSIGIMVIPHTWQHTNLCFKKSGDQANIEIDVIAKYVEQLLQPYHHKKEITKEFLQELGF